MLPKNIILYFDGSCTKPGGIATYGWCIRNSQNQKILQTGHGEECRGPAATSNVAEYAGLENGFKAIVSQSWQGELLIHGDSQLIIFQITEKWQCRKPHLLPYRERCWSLLSQIGHWQAKWIPRVLNEHCDELSRIGKKWNN